MPYLEVKLGTDSLLVRFLGRIDLVFGRLPRVDIQLRDMKVSRLHTQVFMDSKGRAFARDLNSGIGTLLDGVTVDRGYIAPLVDGAQLRIGDARVTYYDAEPPRNAVDPPAQSHPRGLIRANMRLRRGNAEATVIGVKPISSSNARAPAESPPEVSVAEFEDKEAEKRAAEERKAKRIAKAEEARKKKEEGIVEAPWERKGNQDVISLPQKDSVAVQSSAAPMAPPPASAQPAPTVPGTGSKAWNAVTPPVPEPDQVLKRPAPVQPLPPIAVNPQTPPAAGGGGLDTRFRSPVPVAEPGRETGRARTRQSAPAGGPGPTNEEGGAEHSNAASRSGMPTIRFDRSDVESQQVSNESEPALPSIPTAALKSTAPPPDASFPVEPSDLYGGEGPESMELGVGGERPTITPPPPPLFKPPPITVGEGEEDQPLNIGGGSQSAEDGDIEFGDSPAADAPAEAAVSRIDPGLTLQPPVDPDQPRSDPVEGDRDVSETKGIESPSRPAQEEDAPEPSVPDSVGSGTGGDGQDLQSEVNALEESGQVRALAHGPGGDTMFMASEMKKLIERASEAIEKSTGKMKPGDREPKQE